MSDNKTRFDKILEKLKNNKLITVIMIAGIMIITISSFTGSVRNLFMNVSSIFEKKINVTGTWESDTLIHQNNKNVIYKIELTLQQNQDRKINGTMKRFYKDGPNSRKKIKNGEIDDNTIYFDIQFTADMYGPKDKYLAHYTGILSENKIDFVTEDKYGYSQDEFIVKRIE